jgi:hypothetical protein
MSSKSDLSPHSADPLIARTLDRLNPHSKNYLWSVYVLKAYVNFDSDDSGLFDCFDIAAARLRLEQHWLYP